MFVSQEREAARKPFQKPNILRRKSKTTNRSKEKNNETPVLSSIKNKLEVASFPVVQAKELPIESIQISPAPSFGLINISEICGVQGSASQTLNINGDSLTIYAQDAQVDDSDLSTAQSTLNVEAFLNNGTIENEEIFICNNGDDNTPSQNVETETKPKWCLDFGSELSKDIVTASYYDGSQISNIYIDKTLSTCTEVESEALTQSSLNEITTIQEVEEPSQVSLQVESTPVKLMCDVPNCKKSFWTEARLQKHKNVHNKPKTFPVLHCPVKNTDSEGVETQCNRTFQIRNQLMKHLNDDHSPEDALYKCGKCGRRFYWSCGARLHQANGCARSFTCAWAGCGRVFRQQCRLREHARAHTGDRPYPCHYTGCGWSFRSASKLMRHARRHTGERRHACHVCGRAFPRREHLREHVARHHDPPAAPSAAPALPCTHTGCERTFSSTSSLYTHLKKVHKDEDTPQPPKKQRKPKKDTFVLQLSAPAQAAGAAGGEGGGGCARTHCTWPLRRDALDDALVQCHVEQSESCESNIYVRSDMFLHGNLLINEDSEFPAIIGRAGAEGAEGAGAAPGSLGLIDAHPTGDLTQEEFMYADAVDESTFRVFFSNSEELA